MSDAVSIDPKLMDRYINAVEPCVNDPGLWQRRAYAWGQGELKGKTQHDWQDRIDDIIRDELSAMSSGEKPEGPIRIAVRSGHGIGKSAKISMLLDWALATMADCRCIVTANTDLQLRDKTWPEVSKWHRRSISKTFFEWTATTLHSNESGHEKSWGATATPWSERNPEAFQGLHNAGRRVLIFFDEASGIPAIIWESIEGAMTDKDTQIIWIAFGNPTRNSGRFYECFNKFRNLWHTMVIDSRDVPGTNHQLFKEWAEAYGEDSDFFKIRVKGEFPDVSAMQFISSEWVRTAMKRDPHTLDNDPLVCGIDFARNGTAANVMYWRKGRDGQTFKPDIYPEDASSSHFVAKCANRLRDMKPDLIFGDGVGVGGPIIDRLNELGFNVIDIQAGGRSSMPNRHLNMRAEMWAKGKEWIKGGALWDDERLFNELTKIETVPNMKGLTQLESKKSLLARGEASPDVADAFMLTFAYDTNEAASSEYQATHGAMVSESEFDPYADLREMGSEDPYEPSKRRRSMRRHFTEGDY